MKLSIFTRAYGCTLAITLATMMAVIGLASAAQAEIVYHSANITINDGTYNLDLNGDGITDFTIASTSGSCGNLCSYRTLSETAAAGNGAIVGPLGRGHEIGPSQTFNEGEGVMSGDRSQFECNSNKTRCWWAFSGGGPWWGGKYGFPRPKAGYLGLSFQVNGQTYYGWAQLSVEGTSATLIGYAFETIPARAIKAGETSYAWLSSTQLNFGAVMDGTTVSKSLTLENLGPNTLMITNASLTGTNAADFASENGNPPCAGSVAAADKCTLTFTFTPSAKKETATYSVYDDGGNSPQNLSLIGTGK